MRRTSLNHQQAKKLGQALRRRREELGLSVRGLEAASGVNISSIVSLERGDHLAPQPDTLKALAAALDMPVTDLFAVADWLPKNELPTFTPYLRAKYKELPEEAVDEMEKFFGRLAKKHGVQRPEGGEDER